MAETTRDVEGRIFISYRREDAAYPAGWLFDRLAERFGEEQIFKDVDSIELGDDFAEVIGAAVGETDVLLAVIGDKWLTVADERGGRRLDDSEDFVRIEIEAALTRKVRIIPILVEGASMPSEGQLPPSLAPLARRQALELSPARFSSDTGRLLRTLERALAEDRATEDTATSATTAPDARQAQAPPATSVSARVARRARPLAVTLSLAGASLGIIANTQYGPEEGALTAFGPKTLGAPLLVAAAAVLLQAGRIREQLAYGLLLGFGLTTTTAAIGLGFASAELGGVQHSAPFVLLGAGGALVLTGGLLGSWTVARSPGAWATPFRWGPANLLAALGALVAVAALFVRFGKEKSGNTTDVLDLGGSVNLSGIALEPIVAITLACVATYALGKGGDVSLLAAGVVLALAAQTGLIYLTLLGAVEDNYRDYWLGDPKPAGFVVGFAGAALLLAAGLVGRRSP